MEISIKEVAGLTGSRIATVGKEASLDAPVTSLLIDSRSLLNPEGTLFFAIPTASNAGTRYMRDLYNRGVRLFLAPEVPEDMRDAAGCVILVNPDPVGALQKLACRRDGSGGEVVAITGSRGKTTVKEWLFQLLEPLREIARSPRSYNSQIGVPLSMWEVTPTTDLTLIEAGVSKRGEMERLAACIKPDVVIVTDMGPEHAEGFSGMEEKISEKLKLAAYSGVKRVIYCADDAELSRQVEKLDVEKVEISTRSIRLTPQPPFEGGFDAAKQGCEGVPPSNSGIEGVSSENSRLEVIGVADLADGIKRIEYVWKTGGKEMAGAIECELHVVDSATPFASADVRNACYALAFMLSEGYDPMTVASRFARLHPIETRLSVSDGGNGCNIVYDSYTSDLSSLIPAVDFMMRRKVPGQSATVILSDLRHEGHGVEDDYERIARLMALRGVDRFIGVGEAISAHRHLFRPDAMFFESTQALVAYLRETPLEDSIVLVKGSPEFNFPLVKEALEERTHQTLLEVNLDAIIKNYNYFKSHVPASTGMVAMVKASGYGAGSYEIAKTLQDAGAAYLAVAVLDEGLDLRRRGITMPIMVMNPRVADYREMFLNALEPEIYSPRMLEDVIAQAERYGVEEFPIHIKLDTGMHRMGFIEEELPALMERIGGQNKVVISSAFSHLATADEPTMNDYTEYQLENFRRMTEYMLSRAPRPFKRHVLNSAGILRYGNEYHYDMVRLGIGLYGVNTLPADMESPLAVVSTLKTVIINIREWPEGTTIGYGRRGVLKLPSKVATIPIGYADGMSRKFGNGAVKVLVNGKAAPTVGNICMDACMIDVTGIECAVGDRVEIFGEQAGVQRLADVIGTIPYEILTSVSPRVKRIYYRE